MIRILGHPRFERLSRYADAELTGKARERVASHLAGCARCRDTVRFIRELGEVARSLPVPEPPADALPRLLARRAAGVRVILPTSDPVPIESDRRRALPAVAATLVLFMAGALLLSVPRLGADRSRLEFRPRRVNAGTTVQVRYAPGALLASEPTLTLRGRLRFANGNHQITELGTLTRGADGVFHGAVSLPDTVVYAAFAVEDAAASRIDSNNRRLWELLVHGADGRPLSESLRERANDLFARDSELAHETARTATRMYPKHPWGWYTLFRFESALAQGAQRDSLVAYHRDRLRELDRHWSVGRPTADDAAFLALYAMVLGEAEVHERWRGYLMQSAPAHWTSIQFRLSDLRQSAGGRPLLEDLERMGAETGFWYRELIIAGLFEALRVKDSEAAFRWAERYLAIAPEDLGTIAQALAEALPPGEELHAWLHGAVSRITSGQLSLEREPFQTAEEHQLRMAELEASVRHIIARSCLQTDDIECALEHLEAAAAATWNPAVFDALARVLVRRGRTAEATEFLARVAIDPLADSSMAASAVALGRSLSGDDGWARALERAHGALASYVAPHAVYRKLESGLELIAVDGAQVTAGAVLTAGITVVAFWSPQSNPSVDMLPELEQAAQILHRQGIRTVAVQLDRSSTDATAISHGASRSFELYFDPQRDVAAAFGQWGEPEFFVVDQAGIVRYRHSTLRMAIRQATSLADPNGRHSMAP